MANEKVDAGAKTGATNATVEKWKCETKCYANGILYREGDVVAGGDFSKNPNFAKV